MAITLPDNPTSGDTTLINGKTFVFDGVGWQLKTEDFNVGEEIHNSSEKTTPINNDEFGVWDSVGTVLKKVKWLNIKNTLKSYFDTIYSTFSGSYKDLNDKPTDVTNLSLHNVVDLNDVYDAGSGNIITSDERTVIQNIDNTYAEKNIISGTTTSWDGSLYNIDLSINYQQTLIINDSVISISFGLIFGDDSDIVSREAIIIIDNSQNTSPIETIVFDDNSGAYTWNWSIGDPITGIAAGAIVELWVRNRSDVEVKALTDVEE